MNANISGDQLLSVVCGETARTFGMMDVIEGAGSWRIAPAGLKIAAAAYREYTDALARGLNAISAREAVAQIA